MPRRKLPRARVVAGVVSVFALAALLAVLPELIAARQRKAYVETFEAIRVGRTTRDEVCERLGPPNEVVRIRSTGQTVSVWMYGKDCFDVEFGSDGVVVYKSRDIYKNTVDPAPTFWERVLELLP